MTFICNLFKRKKKIPTPDDPIVTEYVQRNVCKVSGKLVHSWCEDTEWIRFKKGTEPLTWCDVHKEPPPPPPPPPPIYKIPNKARVINIQQKLGYPIYITPFFAKDIGINFSEYTREDAYRFISKIAEKRLANSIRMFAWLAYPIVCHYPHPQIGPKKWDVNKINEVWWGILLDTIKFCVERKLQVRLILWDEHSYNRRWDWHWTNPDNNIGYRGKEMYPDRYGHLKWVNYILKGAECTQEEYDGYYTNMEYHLGLWDEIIHRLKSIPEIWPYITFETNELDTGDHGHNFLGDFLDQRGVPRWRMITSPRGGEEWINTKPSINRFWIPEVHGIQGHSDYMQLKTLVTVPVIGSGDGKGANWHLGYEDLRYLMWQVLNDKQPGFSGNNWLSNKPAPTTEEWFAALDYESGEIMMEELGKYLG